VIRTGPNAATNAPTHLLWVDRWIPANWSEHAGGSWTFQNGRDAVAWLSWPERTEEAGG